MSACSVGRLRTWPSRSSLRVAPSGGRSSSRTKRFTRPAWRPCARISARAPKYPGEVPIRKGHAGQTRDAVILCHQLRTIDLARVTTFQIEERTQYIEDPQVRRGVRVALSRHLGLDLPPAEDGAA